MEKSYEFLFDLALILLSTKLLGLLTKRINMPQVVGALLAGLILGPACLNVLHTTDFISNLAEVGVVVLMFSAGLESDLSSLKKIGGKSLVIAMFGVFVPLIVGSLLGFIYSGFHDLTKIEILQNMFIGVVLTATSVSITVEALKEMGKLNTDVSNTILGAALIDDILGIIILTVISSFVSSDTNIIFVLLRILGFFLFAVVVYVIGKKLFDRWFKDSEKDLRRYVVMAFVFGLIMAFISEELFHIADITGAFVAGLVLSGTKEKHYIENRINILSYLFLSPVFFASIGINVTLSSMNLSLIIFTVILVVIAILTKQFGCFIGAKICKMNNIDSMRVGAGMVCRGEVALIVASKGAALGLLASGYMAPIVIMVIVTTIIAPLILQLLYRNERISELEVVELVEEI